jgi:hypothetical protein
MFVLVTALLAVENSICSIEVLSCISHRKLVFLNSLGENLTHYDITCLVPYKMTEQVLLILGT